MKDIRTYLNAIGKAGKELEKWDFEDQLIVINQIVKLGKVCDEMLTKYDGRGDRMMELLNLLGGDDE